VNEPHLNCKVRLHEPGTVVLAVTINGQCFLIYCAFEVYPEVKRRLFESFEREFDIEKQW
jgi:hypothetical protein